MIRGRLLRGIGQYIEEIPLITKVITSQFCTNDMVNRLPIVWDRSPIFNNIRLRHALVYT